VDEDYRQRLLNWFCSILLLLLVCALTLLLAWRIITINFSFYGGPAGIDKYAGPMGVSFFAYVMYFPAIAFWHFCDFLERKQGKLPWKGWFSSYRSFLVLLLLASPIAVFAASRGVELTGCYGVFNVPTPTFSPGNFPLHICPGASASVFLLVIFVWPVMALACLSKAATMLLSRLDDEHD
jgi:hypothetical protein